MALNFTSLSNEITALESKIPPHVLPLFQDIKDTALMTALRAQEVFALYQYAYGWYSQPNSWREQRLKEAQNAISQAIVTVKQREQQYRVPIDRIAGWRNNPTCYHFGYLWTVHSLYYFWRDYSEATQLFSTISPCFMNIENALDVAFGEGWWLNATEIAREVMDSLGLGGFIADCLQAPFSEPHYPLTFDFIKKEKIKSK